MEPVPVHDPWCTCRETGPLGVYFGRHCLVHDSPRCTCRTALGGVYGRDSCPVHGLPGGIIPRGHGAGCFCPDCVLARILTELIVRMEIARYGPPLPFPVIERVVYREQTVIREQPPEPERGRRGPALVLPVVAMLVALAVVSQLLYWFH